MRSFIHLTLIAALMIPLASHSETWVQYDVVGADDSTYYYDKDSVQIKRLGNGTKYLRVWEDWVFTTPPQNHHNNLQPYTEMQTLMYYDCRHHKWEVSRVIYYAQNGSMVGDISLTINESSSATWEEIIPDTVGEDNLTQICRTYRQQLR